VDTPENPVQREQRVFPTTHEPLVVKSDDDIRRQCLSGGGDEAGIAQGEFFLCTPIIVGTTHKDQSNEYGSK
jgi:hypothetical protein